MNIKKSEINIAEIDINKLKPYKSNPRINDNAIVPVIKSIKKFGFRQPIVVDKNMIVIVGHTRLEAAKRMGLKTVPVHIANDMTESNANAYRLADNKTNEFACWNESLLSDELNDLWKKNIDMSEFGFSENDTEENVHVIEEVELKPYKRIHILVSIHPDHFDDIKNELDKLRRNENVEIIQSAN
jgi:site-specific DNA-methyltransferase (adenine-specific)